MVIPGTNSPREALLLLSMMEEGLEADEVTIASALSDCAKLKRTWSLGVW